MRPPFAMRGEYAVGTMELTIEDDERPLTVTIWYPADAEAGSEPDVAYGVAPLLTLPGAAYRDAAPFVDDAPYPLIVYSHGSNGARVVSTFLTEHLASRGFVVIAADHPGNDIQARIADDADLIGAFALRPDDVLRKLDYADNVLNADGGFLAGLIDMENVGVVGHSFGGWTALTVAGGRTDLDLLDAYCADADEEDNVCFIQQIADDLAAARGLDAVPESPWPAQADERIDAVVALAPWNGAVLNLAEVVAPVMIIVGGSDSVTIPERDAFTFYDNLPGERALMTLEYGDHYLFVDECSILFETFSLQYACTDPVWDMARAHDLTNHAATAFFMAKLMGDGDAAAALDSDEMNFQGVTYEKAE